MPFSSLADRWIESGEFPRSERPRRKELFASEALVLGSCQGAHLKEGMDTLALSGLRGRVGLGVKPLRERASRDQRLALFDVGEEGAYRAQLSDVADVHVGF